MRESLCESGGGTCPQTRHRPSGPISCCAFWTAPPGQRHSCPGWCVSNAEFSNLRMPKASTVVSEALVIQLRCTSVIYCYLPSAPPMENVASVTRRRGPAWWMSLLRWEGTLGGPLLPSGHHPVRQGAGCRGVRLGQWEDLAIPSLVLGAGSLAPLRSLLGMQNLQPRPAESVSAFEQGPRGILTHLTTWEVLA